MTSCDEESGEACDILLKLVDRGHVVGCDERAIGSLTRELSAASSYVVIARAVRSCGELFEKLEIRESGEIDSCCFAWLFTGVWKHLQQILHDSYLFVPVELPERRKHRRWKAR